MQYNTSRMRQIEIEIEQNRDLRKRQDEAAIPAVPEGFTGVQHAVSAAALPAVLRSVCAGREALQEMPHGFSS